MSASRCPHLFKGAARTAPNSTWSNASADLFTSPRARQVGDIVTVNIQIDDKAEFDNASDRSRRSSISAGLDYAFSFKGWNADGTGDVGSTPPRPRKDRGRSIAPRSCASRWRRSSTRFCPTGMW